MSEIIKEEKIFNKNIIELFNINKELAKLKQRFLKKKKLKLRLRFSAY